jgi:putative flippase GtrA
MTAHPIPVPARPDHLVLRFVMVGIVAVAVGLLSTLALAAVKPHLFDEPAARAALVAPPTAAPSFLLSTLELGPV